MPAGDFTKQDALHARDLVRHLVAALHPRKRDNLNAEISDIYQFLDEAHKAAPETAAPVAAAD